MKRDCRLDSCLLGKFSGIKKRAKHLRLYRFNSKVRQIWGLISTPQ